MALLGTFYSVLDKNSLEEIELLLVLKKIENEAENSKTSTSVYDFVS